MLRHIARTEKMSHKVEWPTIRADTTRSKGLASNMTTAAEFGKYKLAHRESDHSFQSIPEHMDLSQG